MKTFFVYLLRCADGSFFVGHTDDIDACLSQHADGDVGYTSRRRPVTLGWQGEFETLEGALVFEQRLKSWGRVRKLALINSDWQAAQKHAWGVRHPLPAHLREQETPDAGNVESTVRSTRSDGVVQAPGLSLPRHERAQAVDATGRTEESGTARAQAYLDAILQGEAQVQRRGIAKAITLLESTRSDHRAQGDEMLTALLPYTGQSFRLGISGVPGVGKSTFIEVLGLHLIGQGHRVAVLTIDPSSTVSGGSILGDKTRMEQLSVHEKAYIRPSPSSGTLGGVAEKTREAMLVCEAAGYDIVIVETVGVGQSETAVANMTDMFVLMQLPNAGDDLQAIKKGVMELADLVIINKADIDADAAMRAEAQITSAMRLFGLVNNAMGSAQAAEFDRHWHPQVLQLSALHNKGVDAFWQAVQQFRALQTGNGKLAARRQQQSLSWMWERIEAGLKQAFRQDSAVSALLPTLLAEVASGRLPASTAARSLLAAQRPGGSA